MLERCGYREDNSKKNALVKAISMIITAAHSVALNTYPISLCHENPSSAFKKRRRTESVKDRDRNSFRKKVSIHWFGLSFLKTMVNRERQLIKGNEQTSAHNDI